jgi:hypothetical protein
MAEELSCLRRHRHPGNAAEVRRSRLCKGKRFNSEIISSMIESLITAVRGGRPASIVSVTGSICRRTRMTNSEDNPPPAVGAYWIKEEHYPALRHLFDDGEDAT